MFIFSSLSSLIFMVMFLCDLHFLSPNMKLGLWVSQRGGVRVPFINVFILYSLFYVHYFWATIFNKSSNIVIFVQQYALTAILMLTRSYYV